MKNNIFLKITGIFARQNPRLRVLNSVSGGTHSERVHFFKKKMTMLNFQQEIDEGLTKAFIFLIFVKQLANKYKI